MTTIDPAAMPATRARVAQARAAEDRLISDALEQVGAAPAPTAAQDLVMRAVARTPEQLRRTIPLPLGTQVALGPHPADGWIVVGVGPSDRVQLARRDEGGALHRATRRWSVIAERNPQLLDGPLHDATGRMWNVAPHDLADIAARGRHGTGVGYHSVGEGPRINILDNEWDDALRATGFERRRPIAARPSGFEASALRQLVGDTDLVVSTLPSALDGSAPALIGSDAIPGPGASTIAAMRDTSAWLHEHAGVPSWAATPNRFGVTDSGGSIGNAAAGLDGPDTSGLITGPADRAVREELLARDVAGDRLHDLRTAAQQLDRNGDSVLAHEGFHVTEGLLWEATPTGARATRASVEHGTVREAFSDLAGGARDGNASFFRRLGQLPDGAHDLAEYRRTTAQTLHRADAHLGTQLLTKPMANLARTRGWDFVAEVTGAAAHSIGIGQMRGETAALLDIPAAATALRDAAARRLGAGSAAVRALEDGWKLLRVLP